MAPATKYGGKIVACQPGTTDTAKSNDTIVWTESTSGVASPASISVRHLVALPVHADPRQPSDRSRR